MRDLIKNTLLLIEEEKKPSRQVDSNSGPLDYKTVALPFHHHRCPSFVNVDIFGDCVHFTALAASKSWAVFILTLLMALTSSKVSLAAPYARREN